ncbi:hypothetical protein M9Y10_002590 [Tritrichomonas musculus]|uniref:Uncharacterized protein n=1 Tax=Tritrichomonas musculus TaxID=1915356 RepID=A0ABR2LAK2_9EUKA
MKGKKAKTGAIAIEFKAETDGVALLTPVSYSSFSYTVKCTQCGAERENISFDDSEKEMQGSRGTANFVMTCKDCKRQCNINYTGNNFNHEAEDYTDWQRVITLECRGCSIENASCNEWNIRSESDNKYEWNAADDFFEYDEDLGRPVTVSELEYQIVNA